MKNLENRKIQNGFGLLELLIILLVIAIVVVLALPQIKSSRRVSDFSAAPQQIVSALREARQEAAAQQKPITFCYQDGDKIIVIRGGNFGSAGAAENKFIPVAGSGASVSQDLIYGHPAGASSTALGDGADLTPLTDDKLEIVFQSDGSVVGADDNPQNKALFFYNPKSPEESAFAVSVLGKGGRVKIWRYDKEAKSYVE